MGEIHINAKGDYLFNYEGTRSNFAEQPTVGNASTLRDIEFPAQRSMHSNIKSATVCKVAFPISPIVLLVHLYYIFT